MSKYEGGPAEKPSFHAALREIFMTFVTLSSKYALKTMENLEMDHKKSRSDSQLSHSPSIQVLSHYIQVLSSV